MKDDLGVYYYPNPGEKSVRMYVRRRYGDVEFRLWNSGHAEIWERHDWLPYDEIVEAAEMYKKRGTGADPMEMYDIDVAKRVLADEG